MNSCQVGENVGGSIFFRKMPTSVLPIAVLVAAFQLCAQSINSFPSIQGNNLTSIKQVRGEQQTFNVIDSSFYISSGDQFRLRWWGIETNDMDLVVDSRGDLVIPDIGKIKARNRTLRQVRDSVEHFLSKRIKTQLIDFQLTKITPPQIRISGVVQSPGIYQFPPATRLSVALQAADVNANAVLSKIGSIEDAQKLALDPSPSIRRVLVVRNQSDSAYYDLMKSIRTADPTEDPILSNGDRIILLPQGPVAFITGGSNHNGGVEFIPGESIKSLLFSAGEDSSLKPEISGGSDSLGYCGKSTSNAVFSLPPRPSIKNLEFAWVVGNIHRPGMHQVGKNTRMADVIRQAGGVIGGDDSGYSFAIKRGWEVLAPFPALLSGGSTLHELNNSFSLYAKLTRGVYSEENPVIQPGDTIFVEKIQRVVWVGGQVRKPGYVTWKAGYTVDQYYELAGGLTDNAWDQEARIFNPFSKQLVPTQNTPIPPGAFVIVPESRRLQPEQWISIAVSLSSLALTLTTLFYTASK